MNTTTVAVKKSSAPASAARPKKGGVAKFSLSVLPKESQPASGKAESEAYISLTGLFEKIYTGSDSSFQGKSKVINADTGEESTVLFGLFTMRDTKPEEGMVLKSKPWNQPDGPGTPNITEEKWTQVAVLKGMVRNGEQKYFGANTKGDLYFVNTRKPK